MQKRDKTQVNVATVLLCAFGFSFIVGTGWELFEFTFDQVAGGDSQHWSQELAKAASEAYGNKGLATPWIFDPSSYAPRLAEKINGQPKDLYSNTLEVYNSRYAVIDTMEDIVFNTIGAIAAYIFLKIKPYWHKGKNDTNAMIKAQENASEE